jgi:hypothetical protein
MIVIKKINALLNFRLRITLSLLVYKKYLFYRGKQKRRPLRAAHFWKINRDLFSNTWIRLNLY